jgi:homoserine dehydrogenase
MSALLAAAPDHATVTRGRDATPAPRPAPLRVALAGCGTVGGALAAQLLAPDALAGRRVEIVKVLVRDVNKARPVAFRPGVVTDRLAAFLTAHADVVIETIGGLEPARSIVASALAAGRRVVTANKALVAAHGAALAALAARSGGQLDFEGAVGGCIPVVRALRSGAAGVGVTAVRGVLNGTSNFVLDRAMRGDAPAAAIAEAQRLGFAEADPSRDLDGVDAADKVAILAWLAFGVAPHMLPVSRRALDDALALAPHAAALGGRVAQLAETVATPHGLVARVEPAVLGPAHDLARASGEWNAVAVESASAGTILFAGRGAGGDPTAGALHGDLGSVSAPLPAPRAVQVAARDDRALAWVLVLTAEGDGTANVAPDATDVRVSPLDGGARAIAFTGSPAQAEAVRAAFAWRGAQVALARDLR